MSSASAMSTRALFGGAIEVHLPPQFIDCSDLRPIPDHQEVFAHRDTDQSVIIEIVEQAESVADDQAPEYFFSDLAQCNGVDNGEYSLDHSAPVESSQLAHLPVESCRGLTLKGTQQIPCGQQNTMKKTIQINMAILRLPDVTSEILVTVQHPAGAEGLGSNLSSEGLLWKILASFNIRDWSLFG
eukprot:gb/GECG01013771.1/.p1 GENE.gb/GECG01013771.1/~~gb/GECG01013771.1/.p1  ORF type:complete len:185 (+),score=18.51 gb/GECG01013771.1/:1-555(+)